MIKGLDRRLETFHRLGDCPPALCSVFLAHNRKSGLKPLSQLPSVFKSTARVTFIRFRGFGVVTFKNEESELSFQSLAPRSRCEKTPGLPGNRAFGKAI